MDRNINAVRYSFVSLGVATREGGVDRNLGSNVTGFSPRCVATREGGVDRNNRSMP